MIYRGDGARGLLDYLASKEGSRLLSTNLDGVTPPEFSRQIGEVRRLYFREQVAHPVAHITLRPAPGEDLTDEEWEDTAQLALERLGYDYSPYVAYLHDHGEGRHLHVATYRVNFEGRLVSDSNDRFKLMELARDLERTYGLEVATKKNPVSLTRAELERRLRDSGREAAQQSLRDAIDQAASQHQTVRAFLSELHRLGIQANLKVARKSGVAQGITFTLPDGTTIKGSDLGKKYSLGALCNRYELRLDLRPEGPFLVASEISQREYKTLERDGLAADVAVRYGSRRTLYWQLPPGDEVAFVDLIALRLPHRLLSYADELPSAPIAPPDLEERARKAQVLVELAERGPSIAPPLPLPEPADQEGQGSPAQLRTLAERAERCQTLSTALLGASVLHPADAADLRGEYHAAMLEVLREHQEQPLRPAGAEIRPYETLAAGATFAPERRGESPGEPRQSENAEFRPYETLSTRQLLAELAAARIGSPTAEDRRGERRDLLFQEASLRGLFDLSSLESVAQQGRTATTAGRDSGTLASPISDIGTLDLRERVLRAAWRYESDGNPKTFFEWASLQQSLRAVERRQGVQTQRPATEPLSALERLDQSASTLRFYEETYFRSPSALTARLWSQAERAHLRASLTFESVRLRVQAAASLPPAPASNPERRRQVARGSRSLQNIVEKQVLGLGRQAENLARRATREAWARTPIGRAFLTAVHPARVLVGAIPGARPAVAALDAVAEVGQRSFLLYVELRAASDRLRSAQLGKAQRSLEQGDFSNASLAAAIARGRVTIQPVSPETLPAAVRQARSAEANLLRTYRNFRRGRTSRQALAEAGGTALAARAAVTERLHLALGLPSARDFSAVFGNRQGRALSAWMGTLQKAGLSARAIASSVAEAAPLALASRIAAVAVVAARQLLHYVVKHLQSQVRESFRGQ
jgi:hypothetical protein